MKPSHHSTDKPSLDPTQPASFVPPWDLPSDSAAAPNPFDVPAWCGATNFVVSASTPAPAMALYLIEPGTTAAVSVADLHQDGIGDCFLISSIGELVLTDPNAIQSMIHQNANGTETVTLHVEANGRLPSPDYAGAFKAVTEVVTNTFPSDSVNSGATQDVVNGVKEIWPQVLEKAFAELNGGYEAITNGGYPTAAMEALTGMDATSLWLPQQPLSLAALQGYIKAGDMLTFDTSADPVGYGLYGDHCYMFEGLTTTNGTPMIKLGNPWGVDQPAGIPLSKLSPDFMQVDIGHHG
jgi:hypothetical protein